MLYIERSAKRDGDHCRTELVRTRAVNGCVLHIIDNNNYELLKLIIMQISQFTDTCMHKVCPLKIREHDFYR